MSNLSYIKPRVLQSRFPKWPHDWYQNVYILRKWLYNFCPNLIWTIDIKKFLFQGRLLVENSNLLNAKLEVLQSTFLKWSCGWDQKNNILKKRLHNFCPNLSWTIDFKGFLFEGCLFAKRLNLANIKLEVLQSIFLKRSRDWYQNIKILKKWLHNFCPSLISAFDIQEFLF